MALAAAASTGGSGSDVTTSTPTPRAVWWHLQLKGMTPDEAASLMAFVHGLPTSDLHWTLLQLNQLLFLQRMRQLGRFGGDDGDRKLTP